MSYLSCSLDVGGRFVDLQLDQEGVDGRLADGHQLWAIHRHQKVGKAVLANDLLDGHEVLSGLEENLNLQKVLSLSLKLPKKLLKF